MENTGRFTHIIKLYANCLPALDTQVRTFSTSFPTPAEQRDCGEVSWVGRWMGT